MMDLEAIAPAGFGRGLCGLGEATILSPEGYAFSPARAPS